MGAMIVRELLAGPQNPNQLAEKLGVDYKTITHHLEVLRKMNWVSTDSEKYAERFFPTFTPEERAGFQRISANLGKSFKTKEARL